MDWLAYRKPIFALAVVAFLLGGTFNLAHASMSMEDGQMSGCPSMLGMSAICTMSPLEHIAAWQSTFTSLPSEQNSFFALLLLLVVAFSFVLLKRIFGPPKHSVQECPTFSSRADLRVPIFQELFSNGILHPKLF